MDFGALPKELTAFFDAFVVLWERITSDLLGRDLSILREHQLCHHLGAGYGLSYMVWHHVNILGL